MKYDLTEDRQLRNVVVPTQRMIEMPLLTGTQDPVLAYNLIIVRTTHGHLIETTSPRPNSCLDLLTVSLP